MPTASKTPKVTECKIWLINIICVAKKEVWDTPDPSKKDKKLSPKKKSAAKARAKAAGRPYPNLVDNMAAAKKKGK